VRIVTLEHPASRWTRVERLALLLLGAFAVMVGIVSLWWPYGWDAGIFTWVGDTIRRGGLPYRDAWDQKGPFSFYTYALLQSLAPGDAMWPLRVLDLVLVAGAAVAMADIVRRLVPGTAALWAAVVLVLAHYVTDFWNTAQPDGWIAFLSTIGMALLLRDDLMEKWWPGIVASLLMGIGMLQKPTFAVLLPLPVLAVLLHRSHPIRERLPRAAVFATVSLVPLVAGVIWFWVALLLSWAGVQATGAAAAALGGYLRALGLVPPSRRVSIRQGEDMGRPSLLLVDIPEQGGVDVTGSATRL